jgi:hypothetical protein
LEVSDRPLLDGVAGEEEEEGDRDH